LTPSGLAARTIDAQNPGLIKAKFNTTDEATTFKQYLPRAGEMIAFVPEQLSLQETSDDVGSKTVTILRRIPLHFDTNQVETFFQFTPKWDSKGNVTALYKQIVGDRILELSVALGGTSENGQYTQAAPGNIQDPETQDLIRLVAQNILSFVKAFGEDSTISKQKHSSEIL